MRRVLVILTILACSPNVGRFNNTPISVTYPVNPLAATNGVTLAPDVPIVVGATPSRYTVSPPLPAGIALDGATGIISGTPTQATARAPYTIVAANDTGAVSTIVTITVSEPSPLLAFTQSFVFVQSELSTTGAPSNSGGPYSACRAPGTVPAGLVVLATCEVSGIPSQISAAADYALVATGANGDVPLVVNIAVNPVLSMVPPTALLPGIAGTQMNFVAVGGKPPFTFAVADPSTGTVTSVDAETTRFTTSGADAQIAVTDAEGHTATAAIRNRIAWANRTVSALAFHEDSVTHAESVYLGGAFDRVGFVPVTHILAIDPQTAAPRFEFDPESGFDFDVDEIVSDGTSLYAAGGFVHYRGQQAMRLAKLTLTTGELDTTFTKTQGLYNADATAIALVGKSFYVGVDSDGDYRDSPITGSLLRLDSTTGNLAGIALPVGGQINRIVAYGDGVIAGGSQLSGASGLCLVAGDDSVTWCADGITQVNDIAIVGSDIYAGGDQGLYQVSANGSVTATAYTNAITSLVNNNGTLFAAGAGLTVLDTGGSVLSTPDIGLAEVTHLLIDGSDLLAAGDDASGNHRIVRLSLSDQTLSTTFQTQLGFDSQVLDLARAGDWLLVAGDMTAYQGQAAHGLARFDVGASTFDPVFSALSFDSTNPVTAIAASDDSVFIGGSFGSLDGATVGNFARLSSAGVLDKNFAGSGFDGPVNALQFFAGGIEVGGAFQNYQNSAATNVAFVDLNGTLDATQYGADGSVNALLAGNDGLYIGGSFANFSSVATANLAQLTQASGLAICTPTTAFSGITPPLALAEFVTQNYICAGGSAGLTCSVANTSTTCGSEGGASVPFDIGYGLDLPGGTVFALAATDYDPSDTQYMFVGGQLPIINGTIATNLARLNALLPLNTWELQLDRTASEAYAIDRPVRALITAHGVVYAGGDFSTFAGEPVYHLVAFDAISGERVR